jgi:bifunctional non-homologous end joining protein LigD
VQRQEFVVGGFTEPQGTRSGLGALLLGVHDERGVLQYAGRVGTGFDDRTLASLAKLLHKLRRDERPFDPANTIEGRPHWVAPRLVAEVSFGEWTRDHHVRHAVFRGLREDKEAAAIVREKPVAAKRAPSKAAVAPDAASLLAGVRVTHPDRVIDPASGATKIDLLRYYGLIGRLMMAHLKGRPVSLVRAPEGVGGPLVFQKHAQAQTLPGVRQLDPALYIGHLPMLEVANERGLLSAAQWNVVEFHTQNTGTRSLEHPDRMVFDLDPGEGVPWPQVQEAAELVHAFLGQLGLPSFLKTSGGKGLHLVVPLRKVHDWNTVKGFSQAVVVHMAQTLPKRLVAKSGPRNRVGRIFVDYLRNGLGATTVCAWSARARPGLGVSVPLAWRELAALRSGDQWTVRNLHERLDVGNMPWDDYAKSAKSLNAAMKVLGWRLGAA